MLASLIITKLVKLWLVMFAHMLGYKKVKITAVHTCVHCWAWNCYLLRWITKVSEKKDQFVLFLCTGLCKTLLRYIHIRCGHYVVAAILAQICFFCDLAVLITTATPCNCIQITTVSMAFIDDIHSLATTDWNHKLKLTNSIRL